jgi:hypothetical protein
MKKSTPRSVDKSNCILNLGKIDFPLLRKQKKSLFVIQDFLADNPKGNLSKAALSKGWETLEGVINLIDRIQDEAVKAGVPETKVFGRT